MKQIVRCETLSIRLTIFYLWDKNINMISKIIFRIRLELLWFFLIRLRILIILSLILSHMIDIFIIQVFCNIICSSRIKWLKMIFSDIFISILISMKVSFLLEVRIIWLRFYCSCCVNYNHQWLLCNWYHWLIILICQILNDRILLLFLIFSVIVVLLQRSSVLQRVCWYEIRLWIENMYWWLIIRMRIVERLHKCSL